MRALGAGVRCCGIQKAFDDKKTETTFPHPPHGYQPSQKEDRLCTDPKALQHLLPWPLASHCLLPLPQEISPPHLLPTIQRTFQKGDQDHVTPFGQ